MNNGIERAYENIRGYELAITTAIWGRKLDETLERFHSYDFIRRDFVAKSRRIRVETEMCERENSRYAPCHTGDFGRGRAIQIAGKVSKVKVK